MAKKKKPRPQAPDEVFTMGPMHVARFGSTVVWKADWPADVFAEAQRNFVKEYPKVVQEIDVLVGEIAQLVSALPPDKLLHRAWGEMAARHMRLESETEIGPDEAVSMRMLDYVQSVIAAVQPAEVQRDAISEDDWKTLREKIGKLFEKMNHTYQVCRTAKNKAEDPQHDEAFEEFHFRAQLYWCNVRGSRYQVHQPVYLRDMFLLHSAVLHDLFGITGEQFVAGISKIWHALSLGMQDALADLKEFQRDTMDATERRIAADPASSNIDLGVLMRDVVNANGWGERQSDILGRILGLDLFDVQKITALPQNLLDELAWSPGEAKDFFAEGEFSGWPLRIWPVFKRPFIRLEGRYFCFDLYSLLDNIYRVMQRIVLRLRPDYQEVWKEIQQKQSEELPFRYLMQILPGATTLRQVYYRGRTDAGAIDWCEADGLLIYDDHLFVIEARGGAFTYTPPATHFPAYVASLKNLVLKPAAQGKRFVNYLGSAETVALFDERHNQIAELHKRDFRHVTVCAVTLDPFTELAAQVQHLRKIGVHVGDNPVWAVSVDDLRTYADIFENPLLFLHFVEQRTQAFHSTVIQSDDEFDHLGLYLKHNHYSTYAEEMQGESGARVMFTGYRSDIDKFFSERMHDPNAPCPLKQDTPARILEIVSLLSRGDQPHRAEIASYLLDLGGDWRVIASEGIDEELSRQPTTKRPKPYSTHGSVCLTVFCWTETWTPRDAALAADHARTVLLVNNESRRLLLELTYTDQSVLQQVDWKWVDLPGIPLGDLPRLRTAAEKLRQVRVAKVKAEKGKIGRNEQCPCGSGKKYKKCCLGR